MRLRSVGFLLVTCVIGGCGDSVASPTPPSRSEGVRLLLGPLFVSVVERASEVRVVHTFTPDKKQEFGDPASLAVRLGAASVTRRSAPLSQGAVEVLRQLLLAPSTYRWPLGPGTLKFRSGKQLEIHAGESTIGVMCDLDQGWVWFHAGGTVFSVGLELSSGGVDALGSILEGF